MIEIALLGPGDEHRLDAVAPDVFDHPVRPELVRELLADPRHHIAVALDGDRVVGFASGLHYIHPDKAAELWINEVGVAPTHRRRGIGVRLLGALFEAGVRAGCRQAWVLTERDNLAAGRLYTALGGREAGGETAMFEFELDEPTPEVC